MQTRLAIVVEKTDLKYASQVSHFGLQLYDSHVQDTT